MALWLNGKFWGPWIRRSYLAEIAGLREALLTRVLPALPDAEDAEKEAEAHADAMWAKAMSRPSDGSDDPGDWADWALEQGIERYERLSHVRQAVLNMSAVMLWHLLEQQMLHFHGRDVLSPREEQAALRNPMEHKRLFRLEELERRLADGGLGLERVGGWKKVSELRLVANTVKHGAGDSARRLSMLRPDLFVAPGLEEHGVLDPRPEHVERPAGGDDLYVTQADLAAYFDAATAFWDEFSRLIE